jgi:hypothetical protein
MNCVSDLEREVERLGDLLLPYICERTGLASKDVELVLNAQEDFWDDQPHVIGRLFILGLPVGDEDDAAGT